MIDMINERMEAERIIKEMKLHFLNDADDFDFDDETTTIFTTETYHTKTGMVKQKDITLCLFNDDLVEMCSYILYNLAPELLNDNLRNATK
jgi:hypothetical protein